LTSLLWCEHGTHCWKKPVLLNTLSKKKQHDDEAGPSENAGSLFTEGQKTRVNKTRSDKNTVLLDEKLCTAKTTLR